jgi:hypothetical protein
MKQARSQVLVDVFAHYGTQAILARHLSVSRAAISVWDRIPLKYLAKISKETGIPRQRLRPDLYDESEIPQEG